jgi:hypothetical protein
MSHKHRCILFFLLGNRGDERNKLNQRPAKGRNRARKRAKQSGHGYGACVFPVLPHGQTCRHGVAAQAGEDSVKDLVQGGL